MKFLAVSTFNRAGLTLYGRRMVDSFRRHWPEEVDLRVYSEGWSENLGVELVDLVGASPWLAAFKTRHAGRSRPRDFRRDAVRFAHKVAAVCHAAQTSGIDYLIWLDGDLVAHADINLDALEVLLPRGNDWIAWLDRERMYPECGFYILNCSHWAHGEMIKRLAEMYDHDRLFDLAEWHDSFVLQQVVERSGVGWKSLSGTGRRTSHPLVNGPLGSYLDHLKGSRKSEGRSRSSDLKVKRNESYWR